MNILFTSNKGFLGSSLIELFHKETDHKLFYFDKEILNILDQKTIEQCIDKYQIDIILHNAIKGGRRISIDNSIIFYENILMFENVIRLSPYVKLIFNFDSAASFDRQNDIVNYKETDLLKCTPSDYYGLSKNICARRCMSYDNVYNLRIFNCFGPYETPERMITNNINQYINKKHMLIHKNKLMDFFYINDLFSIILHIINNKISYKDINLCYSEKTTLHDICKKINLLSDYQVPIKIMNPEIEKSYCGNPDIINTLNIPLFGLDKGIELMYDYIFKLQQNGGKKLCY